MISSTKVGAIRAAIAGLGYPTAYDNASYKPEADKSWVRCTILDGETSQASVETRRTIGLVIVQVFVPVNSGDAGARAMAKAVVDLVSNSSISGVRFKLPSVQPVGSNGGFWQMNVNCPIWDDEIIL